MGIMKTIRPSRKQIGLGLVYGVTFLIWVYLILVGIDGFFKTQWITINYSEELNYFTYGVVWFIFFILSTLGLLFTTWAMIDNE